ncbi:NADP-dependent oxidoreductase [Pseudonocardia cypriaca]|uniref:NADPH:quinone reductase-like Zn-dependent oxidoreductase n=1 Tax=Pseudonocardia cypriaca TaxID=882449 RepID=A0A543FT35_9PSEU|nr:NADP-dependent oxidoreductase [Pseudonocardia cypriaca]TQM36981.1 NADPH:quinone reductase-like Zn-dependent oxidoreductase [Pseudonocardia cypriaca]
MRAVRIDRFGGPEVLAVQEVPDPVPASGEVLVRVVASSINPVDAKTRADLIRGGVPELPMILGWDLAGIVVHPGASSFEVGDRVVGMSAQLAAGRGTWADLVALPERVLAPAPAAAGLVEAATLPLPGLTASQAVEWLDLSPGQRLLVTGAIGAVGGMAVQLAVHAGVVVDALVSRDAQREQALALGATEVVTDVAQLGRGHYDGVLDTAGVRPDGAVRDGGRLASVATEAGPVPDLSGRGIATTNIQIVEDGARLVDLVKLVDDRVLRLRVDSVHPVHRVREAHERFARGRLDGKIVLVF